ncbi:hypothetical protein [Sediminibacillus massiliensis]|uniref:hypothetical protein n=1 Tax=Sediminibacillus massiliensis TaxID=1926277 RepID=UPI0009886286|nr:hypothetical protein [Sediminibacillus massiliensis]
MKQLFWVALLVFGAMLYFSNPEEEQQTKKDMKQEQEINSEEVSAVQPVSEDEQAELVASVEDVLTVMEELKRTVLQKQDAVEEINKIGKKLADTWDHIEKKVEERYPDDYKNIEESLYPLIAYAQNEKPDFEKMSEVFEQTEKKLKEFKEKISS